MAVPLAVAQSTVSVSVLGSLRVTVKVRVLVSVLPSATALSVMERDGGA